MSRVVVVTGGAKGIGLATVERFAAAGDTVIALGRDRAALNRLDVRTAVCDVTDEDQVNATFAEIGAVDVLVNNAGVAESAPIHRISLHSWRHHFEVNATGAFLCLRAVVPQMREQNHGAVITVASTAGRRGAAYVAAYTASKHAVIGLTRAAAAELGPANIRVNAVCPTYVRSEMTERTIANIVERTGRTPQEAEQELTKDIPLKRLLEPDEVAGAVYYLASDAARAINGQSIVIDGGRVQA
jgi:NAD(P)-dependent dehydrogenase (short-subunit alcohol dehydrogenase family)